MRLARRLGAHCALLLITATLRAEASDVVAALPHTLYRGVPRGWTSTEGVDGSRSYRMTEPPVPGSSRVLWQTQVPGGVSCNLLADDLGRVFVAGQGLVTELTRDGTRAYARRTGSAAAVVTTLLANGARAVLTRDGRLRTWSASGKPGFVVELDAPTPWVHGTLLPLPRGAALVSVGPWLFEVELDGAIVAHTRLKQPVEHTLLAGERVAIVDAHGGVFAWDGESAPARHGSFGGRVTRVVAQDPTTLVGLVRDRVLVEVSLTTRASRELSGSERPGLAPVLALSGTGSFALMKTEGTVFVHGPVDPPVVRAPGEGGQHVITDPHLLASDAGTLVWFAANSALRLERQGELQEIADVRCTHPVSLVPAGRARVVAGCRSGQVWMIGPGASAAAKPAPPGLER